jgi:hypothetical protein
MKFLKPLLGYKKIAPPKEYGYKGKIASSKYSGRHT